MMIEGEWMDGRGEGGSWINNMIPIQDRYVLVVMGCC